MTFPILERFDAVGVALPVDDVNVALKQGEALHRELRPNLDADYVAFMRRMAEEGARILQIADEGEVRALAVWRDYLTTYCGRRFEVDDLVTGAAQRSKGYGATIMRCLEQKAAACGAESVMLVSATHRTNAHRFYFRERFAITAFLFVKPL